MTSFNERIVSMTTIDCVHLHGIQENYGELELQSYAVLTTDILLSLKVRKY